MKVRAMLGVSRSIAAACLCLALARPALADEGMWTFDNVPVKAMQAKYGFAPDAAWLQRVQRATLRFPGASGAFVSDQGLVLTNHHVARGAIQQLSSAQRDLIRDGYLAASREAELPVPGLELIQLVSTRDVSEAVRAAVKPGMSDDEAQRARRNALSTLRQAEEASSGLSCEPVTLYQGGEYWIYRYRKFKDVRLVAAPELQMAQFGGDADNFTYPRWSLDFALFRVYEGGKTYQPDSFLPFARTPLRAGDPTAVVGHPGSTFREQTLAQMRLARDVLIPDQLAASARLRQDLMAFSRRSAEARRVSADAISGIDNTRKRQRGQLMGLMRPESLAQVEARETALRAAVARDPALQARAGASWERIAAAVQAQRTLQAEFTLMGPRASVLLAHALTLVRLPAELAKPSAQRLPAYTDGSLPSTRDRLANPRPVNAGVETVRLAWMLREARQQLGSEHPFVQALLAGRAPEDVARDAISGTRLGDAAFRQSLADGRPEALAAQADPLLALARRLDPFQRDVQKRWDEQVASVLAEHGGRIAQARFAVLGRSVYPDATFTLRLSYGPVASYPTGSGSLAPPFTTFGGLFDRHAGWGGNASTAEDGAWHLPERWLRARPALDADVPYNFVYDGDTAGGSSGSPVVNAQSELVGINFDGVMEGQGGYYVYDAETKRAIAVDVRAIVQALDRVMGGAHLVRELAGR